MATQERRIYHTPPELERRANILWVDPAELIGNNPAALIINQESYRRMSANFEPYDQLDPPQVAWVQTYSSDGAPVRFLGVIDGLTRTAYFYNHKGTVHPKYPEFSYDLMEVRDVTKANIENPEIVRSGEKTKGQDFLTMTQFLRAVVPPTAEHTAIAPDRIAAHLINAWIHLVGPDIAKRYSALSGISTVTNPKVPTATTQEFVKFLKTQPVLMANETPEERVRIEQALIETASIINEAKLFKNQVAESTFTLVSTGSDVIGGTKQSALQVYGLLHTPSVERKLAEEINEVAIREQMRTDLGRFILDAMSKANEFEKQEVLNTIIDALKDPDLTLTNVIDVATSPKPSGHYDEIRKGINFERLSSLFTSITGRQPTDMEHVFVNSLGNKTYVRGEELRLMVDSIVTTAHVVLQVDKFIETVRKNSEMLQSQGVSVDIINQTLSELTRLRTRAIEAETLTSLNSFGSQLGTTSKSFEQRINRQTVTHEIRQMANKLFTEHEGGYGTQIREAIVQYAILHIGVEKKTEIKLLFEQLHTLPTELQARVVNGGIPLERAIRTHEEEQARLVYQNTHPEVKTLGDNPEFKDKTLTPPEEYKLTPQKREINATRAHELAARRVNLKINAGLQTFLDVASAFSINFKDLSVENRILITRIFRILGKMAYDHPDVTRIIEDHFKQLEERRRQQAQKITEEQATSQEETLS